MDSSKPGKFLPLPDGAVAPTPVGEPRNDDDDDVAVSGGFVDEIQGFDGAVKSMNLKLTDGRARMVGSGGRACQGKTDAPLRE